MKPFFDVVSLAVIELTAQLTTCKSSQIARNIDEKLCIGDIVFLSEAMEERRPQKSGSSDVLRENCVLVNVGGSLCASDSVCTQFQTAQ
jgi:hypothetical protein